MEEDNKTLWCGNLSEQVNEELLYELFLQAGPLEKVRIPRDRDGRQKNFAFITFCHDVSVPYAISLFRGTALFHRTLTLQCRERMAPLPPPIRCASLDQPYESVPCPNLQQQFAEMTQNLQEMDYKAVNSLRQARSEDLVMASLQGNWSHRHHPYDRNNRDNVRNNDDRKSSRDNFLGRNDHGRNDHGKNDYGDHGNHARNDYSDHGNHGRNDYSDHGNHGRNDYSDHGNNGNNRSWRDRGGNSSGRYDRRRNNHHR